MLPELQSLIDFHACINNLKFTYRFSESPELSNESSAAHSWNLAMIVITITDTLPIQINKERALELALIHDLVEVITGDIDYYLVHNNTITVKTKKENEKEAIIQLTAKLPEQIKKKIINLFDEFELQETVESNYIKALDRLETISNIFTCGLEKLKDPKVLPTYADKAIQKFPALMPWHTQQKKILKKYFTENNIIWEKEYNYGLY